MTINMGTPANPEGIPHWGFAPKVLKPPDFRCRHSTLGPTY